MEADCTNAAGVNQTCANCGETQVIPFEGELADPPKGHTSVAVEDVAATCATKGWTGKTVCSVCGEVTNPGTEVAEDPESHKAVLSKVLKPASCDEPGVGKFVCEYCGTSMGYKAIEVEHVWSEDILNDKATAIYRECVSCGTTEVIQAFEGFDPSEPLVPAHTHALVVVSGYAPTCTEVGMTDFVYCEGCNYVAGGEVIPAPGHALIDDAAVEATCTEAGKTAGKHCENCDYTEGGEEIPAPGHALVDDAAVPPTCTEDGKAAGKHCENCDYTEGGDPIPTTGHNYVDTEDYDENGELIVISTCSKCGDTK